MAGLSKENQDVFNALVQRYDALKPEVQEYIPKNVRNAIHNYKTNDPEDLDNARLICQAVLELDVTKLDYAVYHVFFDFINAPIYRIYRHLEGQGYLNGAHGAMYFNLYAEQSDSSLNYKLLADNVSRVGTVSPPSFFPSAASQPSTALQRQIMQLKPGSSKEESPYLLTARL